MNDFIILLFLVVIILLLFGFIAYLILTNITKKHGETELEGEINLCKVFEIKLKAKHKSNQK